MTADPNLHLVIRCGGWVPSVVYISRDEAEAEKRLAAFRATLEPHDGVSYHLDTCPLEDDGLVDALVRDAVEA